MTCLRFVLNRWGTQARSHAAPSLAYPVLRHWTRRWLRGGGGRDKHLSTITSLLEMTQRRPVSLRPAAAAKVALGRTARESSLGKSLQGGPCEHLGRALQARPQCSQTGGLAMSPLTAGQELWHHLALERPTAHAWCSLQRLHVRNGPRVMGRGLSLVSVHLPDS